MRPQRPRITSMETRVELHITSYEAKNFRGWVYNSHFQKKIEFYDLCGMLSSMESLYDTLAFPQATFQPRHFGKVKKTEFIAKKAVDAMAMEENDRATFVGHVQFRQNATWQGTIQWVESNKTQNFRSTLEMIKLIDEALDDGANMKISWED